MSFHDSITHLNTEPEHGENTTADNGEIPQVISETTGGYDGEGDVQLRSDGTIEHDRDRHGQITEEHDRDRFSP